MPSLLNRAGIPFNRPATAGAELRYVADAIESGHLAGDGPYTARCQSLLEQALGAHRALLTTSCTHALEMAGLLLGVGAGDEVIVPAFTFPSVANAFVLRGARPVFADVRRDTLNIDETRLEALITPRTKAINVVHYGGVACEMDAILEIARRHSVAVVEDAAHAVFGRYKGRPLGTMGVFGALSFHGTKNFTCGEGGALLLPDEGLVERAEIIRQKGTNRGQFLRGRVDAYTWVHEGSSFAPSDVLAAFLLAQLEAREDILAARARVWNFYAAHLESWAERAGVRLPIVPDGCEQTHHVFYLLVPSAAARPALMDHLAQAGIAGAFHYQPLHLSAMGRRFGGGAGDCPVTEDVSQRLVRLPVYPTLPDADLERIVDVVTSWDPR
jgi:dTDP-4-amino-4,6-dideoxygalactose transaminase